MSYSPSLEDLECLLNLKEGESRIIFLSTIREVSKAKAKWYAVLREAAPFKFSLLIRRDLMPPGLEIKRKGELAVVINEEDDPVPFSDAGIRLAQQLKEFHKKYHAAPADILANLEGVDDDTKEEAKAILKW